MTTPKHIGILACSYEGAALCYREIGAFSANILGPWNHPRITIDSIPMAAYLPSFDAGDHRRLAEIMSDSITVLARAGADFAICPDNSCHVALEYLRDLPIPLLSIVDVVACEAQRLGLQQVAILGTRITMGSAMYPRAFASRGVKSMLPEAAEQKQLDRIIFEELVTGAILDASRAALEQIVDRMRDAGCDGAALVCTELPLLLPRHGAVQILNSTQLLAAAAVAEAVSG
jgi:aspartate racemase